MPEWWEYPITQGYGPTDTTLDSGYAGAAHFNKGYDYGTPMGTPIKAIVGGTVLSAGDAGDGWGYSVKVRDAQGNTHNYGHLSGVNVKPGQTVDPGMLVGSSGNSGRSTGPHLSYDVWTPSGEFINPEPFVNGRQNLPYTGQPVTRENPVYTGQPAVRENLAVGPAGRTFDQITGTKYLSDDERNWWFAQKGQTPPALITPPTAGSAGLLQTPSAGGSDMPPNPGPLAGLANAFEGLMGTGGGGAPAPAASSIPGLPPGTQQVSDNLARYLDPATGEYIYFRNNPAPYLDVATGQIVPAGWVNTGSLPQPNAASNPAEASKNIRVNSATGKAYVVDNQGNIVRPAPEFDEPLSAKQTAPQGAVTTAQLQGAGAQMGVGTATLNGQRYVQNPDGTWQPSGTPTTPESAKKSPAEQAAQSLVNTQRILKGDSAEAPASQPWGDGTQAAGPSSLASGLASVGRSSADPSTVMGGGSPYRAEPREIRGPADIFGQPGSLVGVEVPTMGGSYQFNNGQAAQTIAAAGMIPTGDPQKDLQTAMGINAKRANMLAEPGATPLSVQSIFDTMNLGNDVYSRAKAVQATTTAADRALSGERLPPYGTDQLTASQLAQYVTPQREEEEYVYYPEPVAGFAGGGSVSVTDEQQPKPVAEVSGPSVPVQPTPVGAPLDPQPTMPGMDSVEMANPARVSALDAMGRQMQNDGMPRYTANGLIKRDMGFGQVERPITGGPWRESGSNQIANAYQNYVNEAWNGQIPSVNSYNYSLFQHLFPQYLTKNRIIPDIPGGGAWDWRGGGAPSAMIGGRPYQFNQGGQVSVQPQPIASYAGGGQMVTDEPMVGIGMHSRLPRFTVGEPNALTGGQPTQEILSGGNGTMNVTPMEPSVPMPMPQMQAPYKAKRPIPLVDPLRALMSMGV